MASRRTRIKGIANIPQRKKTVPDIEIPASHNVKLEEDNNSDIDNSSKTTKDVTQIVVQNGDQANDSSHTHITSYNVGIEKTEVISYEPSENTNQFKSLISDSKESENINDLNLVHAENITIAINNNSENSKTTLSDEIRPVASPPKLEEKSAPSIRRKFLKPGINLNVIKQRNVIKENVSIINKNKTPLLLPSSGPAESYIKDEIREVDEDSTLDIDSKTSDKVIVLSEIRIPKDSTPLSKVSQHLAEVIGQSAEGHTVLPETTLDDVVEIPRTGNNSRVTFSTVKEFVPEGPCFDSEYPAPPPSPSKINRSRIKAIPRLSFRKSSCSVSESEDESRKYGRIRNNSVCSVASITYTEPPTPTSEYAPQKEVLPVTPKKVNRTEQSKKLAEARREFNKRFGDNMPDKQKLKMIDLIFYNPTTNPMSPKNTNIKNEIESDTNVQEKQEKVDDPVVPEEPIEEKENDVDNNSMPVPQIKIGPSGEIILDEQSLIVENAELTKQKEQIKNSNIVDGDFDTGYGIYKRVHRTLPWSQKDTLRFYKALNLIGTDFTVMTQLFPKRTRRELKMKFKKEEKINRQLIDRAIMQPCMYNFTDLKREMQIEHEEEAFMLKLKEEELQKIKEDKEIKRKALLQQQQDDDKEAKREKKRKINQSGGENSEAKSVPEIDGQEKTLDLPLKKRLLDVKEPREPKVKKPPKASKPKVPKLDINSVIEDDDDDDIAFSDATGSDTDEEEIIPYLKPTRSGRMPKSTIKFAEPDEPIRFPRKRILKKVDATTRKPQSTSRDLSPPRLPACAMRDRRMSSTSSVESNSDRLVPGSVVITTEEGPTGETEYKVFMVTPDKKLTPLQLDSDVIAKLVKERQSAAEFPLAPSIDEKNLTIAAVEEEKNATKEKEILVTNYIEDNMTETEPSI